MKNSNMKFLGFRGNIIFDKQPSLFNYKNLTRSEYKNEIFKKAFDILKSQKSPMIKDQVFGREYYLYFIKMHTDTILQCKLVRQSTLRVHDLGEKDIEESVLKDYPYINIFVELSSQKFLIESNQSVFADYKTSVYVLENLINTVLFREECFISIIPIVDEVKFWDYIDDSIGIYEVEFNLKAPNIFDGETEAETILKEIEEKTMAKNVSIKLSNDNAKLTLTRNNIDSYVKYTSAGGGDWTIKKKSNAGKKETIKSINKCRKIILPLANTKSKDSVFKKNTIENSFKSIESVSKFIEDNKNENKTI